MNVFISDMIKNCLVLECRTV